MQHGGILVNRLLQNPILPCLGTWLMQVNAKKDGWIDSQAQQLRGTKTMKLMTDLFTTDYGLLSLGSIVFTLGMGVFFIRMAQRKMAEDARAANSKK